MRIHPVNQSSLTLAQALMEIYLRESFVLDIESNMKKSTVYPSYLKQKHLLTHVGPITVRMFSKLQHVMNNMTDFERVECLYKLLVLMKEQEAKEQTEETEENPEVSENDHI